MLPTMPTELPMYVPMMLVLLMLPSVPVHCARVREHRRDHDHDHDHGRDRDHDRDRGRVCREWHLLQR